MQWLSEQADSSPSNVRKQLTTQEPGFPQNPPLVLAGQISAEFHLPQNWERKKPDSMHFLWVPQTMYRYTPEN